MKILILSAVGLVAINIADHVCAFKRMNLLLLQVSHMVLARDLNKEVNFSTMKTEISITHLIFFQSVMSRDGLFSLLVYTY